LLLIRLLLVFCAIFLFYLDGRDLFIRILLLFIILSLAGARW
jgi:hypothetical protein